MQPNGELTVLACIGGAVGRSGGSGELVKDYGERLLIGRKRDGGGALGTAGPAVLNALDPNFGIVWRGNGWVRDKGQGRGDCDGQAEDGGSELHFRRLREVKIWVELGLWKGI